MSLFKKVKTEQGNSLTNRKKNRRKKLIKIIIILIIVAVVVIIGYQKFIAGKVRKSDSENTVQTAKVETRDIQNVLTSSGTIQPLNTYDVKTLVEGEVISAEFEEGEEVKEGQVLYQITTDTLDKKIETARTSVTRAEKNYDKAVDNYDKAKASYEEAQSDYKEAAAKYKDLSLTSAAGGIITELMVKEGDTVQKGSQLAKIYDNSYMLLDIYFNSSDVTSSLVGKSASISIEDSTENLKGTVTKISSVEEVLSGNRLVKKVTIKVKNPGGITTTTMAAATIGSLSSSEEGTFKVLEDSVITADKAGEISKLLVKEGDKVTEGETIGVLDKETYSDQLESYEKAVENAKDSMENMADSVESAKESIEDAESSLEEVIDTKTDYSITAPISGKVIRKDALEGDTINSQSSLCVIYDLSSVTFEMYVDELDVKSVAVNQEVNITADALENTEIHGVVTNISLESTTSGGVTQYPVTVRIDEVGELLPGMNVTGEIVIEKAEGVLAIPADALMRGDVVYVKDATAAATGNTKAEDAEEADQSSKENLFASNIPDGFKAVQVETGLTDGDYIEIKSGLTANDEVYVQRNSSGETQTMMPGMFNIEGGQGMPGGGQGGNWQGGTSGGSGRGSQGGQGSIGGGSFGGGGR
ncbi:efflux RND transporter periplasmic adaptor subunit [Clostridium sp. KNHs205]|jgi:HlyD family secretion protein|uniref:efflux RND transporter periplasmic adaptor subunit n=1 Tax=Clostridium sp. KNHs205 TaxID=1449050 RepID=UPI00051BB25B|nr:efflux RND transporter periplasmic adaptor subunit [Clostridium sp. KNHs205]